MNWLLYISSFPFEYSREGYNHVTSLRSGGIIIDLTYACDEISGVVQPIVCSLYITV